MDLTLQAVLTAGGMTAGAALITGVIAVLKQVRGIGPLIDAGNEPTAAFVLAGVLVLAAVAASGAVTAESAFVAVLAWFGIAQIAMGVHDTIKSATAATPAPAEGQSGPQTPTPTDPTPSVPSA